MLFFYFFLSPIAFLLSFLIVLSFQGHNLFYNSPESDSLWWDAFATEFFEEDATLTLSFCLEDGPKRYSKSPAAPIMNY
uniref:Uncharacterized protein n=1 Tax=Labrus bergylta TaxID=56723 RepID=A0A3Q3FU01_9LABR